jgi:hypothetical protein
VDDLREDQEAAGRVDVLVEGREAGLCLDAGFVPSASNTSRSLITKTLKRFGGLFLTGPKLNRAAVLESAPSTSVPCVSQYSAPVT